MRDASRSTRRPQWTEEEYHAYLRREGTAESLPVPLKKQPVSKYGNRKVTTSEGTFDSKGEYRRWCELRLRQNAGLISDLEHHKKIPIEVNGLHICDYEADFVYWEGEAEVWEDFKGVVTEVFRLKQKLVYAVHGKEVRIVKNAG